MLLSDALRWDMVLHGHPLHTPGEAKCYRQACDLLGLPDHWSHDHPDLRRRIEASWHRCLHPAPAVPGLRTDPTSAVQAVLWTIQPGHVTAWRTPKGQVHR